MINVQAGLFDAAPTAGARLDPTEAPPGYYAVLKADAKPRDGSNICRACDWRPDCDQFACRCSSYTVISSRDGSELRRRDGCDVLFKRIRAEAAQKGAT